MDNQVKEKKLVSIIDISPNLYNPQEMKKSTYSGLIANIQKHGFTDPIKIRPVLEEEKKDIDTPYVIVDGEHRFRAFIEAYPEEEKIDCILTPMKSMADSMQATMSADILRGESTLLKKQRL